MLQNHNNSFQNQGVKKVNHLKRASIAGAIVAVLAYMFFSLTTPSYDPTIPRELYEGMVGMHRTIKFFGCIGIFFAATFASYLFSLIINFLKKNQ